MIVCTSAGHQQSRAVLLRGRFLNDLQEFAVWMLPRANLIHPHLCANMFSTFYNRIHQNLLQLNKSLGVGGQT